MVLSIFTHVAIRPHSVQTLQELRNQEAVIHLITARSEKFRGITEEWLRKHNVPYDALHMNPSHGQGYSKGEKCVELGVEFFVDDNLENCVDAAHHGVNVVLFEASHNKGRKTTIQRVTDWLHIRELIHSMLHRRSHVAR